MSQNSKLRSQMSIITEEGKVVEKEGLKRRMSRSRRKVLENCRVIPSPFEQ